MPHPRVANSSLQPTRSTGLSSAQKAALDEAFAALKSYDLGSDRGALLPIDEELMATLDDSASRKELERRLAIVLQSAAPAPAKEYICRKLGLIGSSTCVPALRELLADSALSTAARTALEKIPGNEAIKALRQTLPKLSGAAKVGLINSLGNRRDSRSVSALTRLLRDPDPQIAAAAAAALGQVGSAGAAGALLKFQPQARRIMIGTVAEACLVCAERLGKEGNRKASLALYRQLNACELPAHFKLAISRGLAAAKE